MTISGRSLQKSSNNLPIRGLLIHDHNIVREIVPHERIFPYVDHGDPSGTWSSRPSRGGVKNLSSHCHFLDAKSMLTSLCMRLYPQFLVLTNEPVEDIWSSRYTIGGGAYPEIEPTEPVMALLSSEHITVHEF
jgi:hypothetical protein